MARIQNSSLIVLGSALIVLTLWAWGQPLICTCGTVKLWVPTIFSSDNSQHIADWYTLSHILHGVLIILAGRLLGITSFPLLFVIAWITGVGWEIVEHTDWVLDKFRATTINQGYLGDSVLNATMDFLFMYLGFFIAHGWRTSFIIAFILVLELTAGLVARDNFALSTLSLIYPIEAIEAWQQELNPQAK